MLLYISVRTSKRTDEGWKTRYGREAVTGFFLPLQESVCMFLKTEHLVTSFALGMIFGTVICYYVERHLDTVQARSSSNDEQIRSLQSAHKLISKFREQNFSNQSPSQR